MPDIVLLWLLDNETPKIRMYQRNDVLKRFQTCLDGVFQNKKQKVKLIDLFPLWTGCSSTLVLHIGILCSTTKLCPQHRKVYNESWLGDTFKLQLFFWGGGFSRVYLNMRKNRSWIIGTGEIELLQTGRRPRSCERTWEVKRMWMRSLGTPQPRDEWQGRHPYVPPTGTGDSFKESVSGGKPFPRECFTSVGRDSRS